MEKRIIGSCYNVQFTQRKVSLRCNLFAKAKINKQKSGGLKSDFLTTTTMMSARFR